MQNLYSYQHKTQDKTHYQVLLSMLAKFLIIIVLTSVVMIVNMYTSGAQSKLIKPAGTPNDVSVMAVHVSAS